MGPDDRVLEISALDAIPGSPESVAAGVGDSWPGRIDTVIAMDGRSRCRPRSALAEQGLADRLPRSGGTEVGSDPAWDPQGLRRAGHRSGVLGEQEIAGRRRAHRRSGQPQPRSGSSTDLTPATSWSTITRHRPLRRPGLAHDGRDRT